MWSSAACSNVGLVRKINEDAFLDQPQLSGDVGVWAVADGMGGHEAGDVASQTIVKDLGEMSAPESGQGLAELIMRTLQKSNQTLQQASAQHYRRKTIGSTVVVFATYQYQGMMIWAGDSRGYRLRGGKLVQLTRDHSHVQEMVDRGLISAAEAQQHPMSNVITRAIGSQNMTELEIKALALQVGDIYMLCSDGLSKLVSEEEIARCLSLGDNEACAQALIQSALDKGADDNVTAAVISIQAMDESNLNANTIPLDDVIDSVRNQGMASH